MGDNIVITGVGKQKIKFSLPEYKELFGEDFGAKLFHEFSAIVEFKDPDKNTAEIAKENRKKVYLSIWNVFQDKWTDYIACIKKKRAIEPLECKLMLCNSCK